MSSDNPHWSGTVREQLELEAAVIIKYEDFIRTGWLRGCHTAVHVGRNGTEIAVQSEAMGRSDEEVWLSSLTFNFFRKKKNSPSNTKVGENLKKNPEISFGNVMV